MKQELEQPRTNIVKDIFILQERIYTNPTDAPRFKIVVYGNNKGNNFITVSVKKESPERGIEPALKMDFQKRITFANRGEVVELIKLLETAIIPVKQHKFMTGDIDPIGEES